MRKRTGFFIVRQATDENMMHAHCLLDT